VIVDATPVRGHLVYDGQTVLGQPGQGQFIRPTRS